MMVSPEEIQSSGQKIVNAETLNYYQVMRMVNTDFNKYFQDKKITVKNYSQYLQTLITQKKPLELQQAFQRMEIYGLKPNLTCYMFLIQSYGQSKNILKAESVFDTALELFGWNIFIVNSMLCAYKHLKNYQSAMNLFQLSKLKGLQSNEATYTNLIILCSELKMTDKCWELFEEAKKEQIQIDDFLMGVMIGLCSQTQDAEKAINMWDQMTKMEGIQINALHYSALIKTLSTRIDYCERALEIYEEMKHKKIQPNQKTFVYSLRAASKLGNIAVAYELALQMRNFNYKVNPQVSYFLIETYSNALKNPMVPTNLKEKYFKDSWTIINNLIEIKKINSENLNALLKVHLNSNKLLEAEEIVLPLFDSINLQKTSSTYQMFFEHFYKKNELQSVFNLYNKLRNKDKNLLSRVSLDIVLKSYFAVKDMNKIIDLLDEFIQRKQEPNRKTLIEMSKSKNIPDSIFFRINKFSFILKRSHKKKRVYGEYVNLIHVDGKIRSKSVQKRLFQDEQRDNIQQYSESVQNQVDSIFLDGQDNPENINDDDYEDEQEEQMNFKHIQEEFNDYEDQII